MVLKPKPTPLGRWKGLCYPFWTNSKEEICGDGNGRLSDFLLAIVDISVKKRMVDVDSPDEVPGVTSAKCFV